MIAGKLRSTLNSFASVATNPPRGSLPPTRLSRILDCRRAEVRGVSRADLLVRSRGVAAECFVYLSVATRTEKSISTALARQALLRLMRR